MIAQKEELKTIQVSASIQGELAELVGRKKRLGKAASIKGEVERAIAVHVKKEWKKIEGR